MQKKSTLWLVVLAIATSSPVLTMVGCGGSSGEAEMKTYPAITPEEEKVIQENMESLKDDH